MGRTRARAADLIELIEKYKNGGFIVEGKPRACKGLTQNGKPCKAPLSPNEDFCKKVHKVFLSYTQEELDKYFEIPDDERVPCKTCKNFKLMGEDEIHCTDCEKKLVKNYDKSGKTQKCIGIFQGGEPCIFKPDTNSKFCKQYHGHMRNYTQEQIDSIERCSKCRYHNAKNKRDRYCIHCTENNTTQKSSIQCDGTRKNFDVNVVKDVKDVDDVDIDYIDADNADNVDDEDIDVDVDVDIDVDVDVEDENDDVNDNDANDNNVEDGDVEDVDVEDEDEDEDEEVDVNDVDTDDVGTDVNDDIDMNDINAMNGVNGNVDINDVDTDITSKNSNDDSNVIDIDINDDTDVNDIDSIGKSTATIKKKYIIKCGDNGGFTAKKKKCRKKIIKGTKFCRAHKDLNSYTPEMLADQKLCKSGNHVRYCGKHLTCEGCRKNGRKNRENTRNTKVNLEKCIVPKCPWNCKNGSKYCGVHERSTEPFKAHVAELGMKTCANVIRTCRNMLPLDYEYEKCAECLGKANIKDRERYNKRSERVIKSRENSETGECLSCHETKELWCFKTKSGACSKKCNTCRSKMCAYDRSRIRKDVHTNEKHVKECIRNAQEHRRDIKWELTMEQAIGLVTLPCEYCGFYEEKMNDDGVKYSTNGIDRIDNDGCYTIGNVVPACKICNFMKYTISQENFIKYCHNIYKYIGAKNKRLKHHKPYSQYKYEASERGIMFKIDIDTYNNIVSYDCYYCDGKNGSNQVGIDRVKSYLPYCTKTNELVAACKYCNQMKNDHELSVFYNHILKILLFNGKITAQEYDKNLMQHENTELKRLIDDLKKSMMNEKNDISDSMPVEEQEQLINEMWNSFDCTTIVPDFEICTAQKSLTKWISYRDAICNSPDTNLKGLKILISDKNTHKCIGIVELSYPKLSTINYVTIKNFLQVSDDILDKNLGNIMCITTCEPLQPFGHNFCGKSLLLKILFSRELYKIINKKIKKNIYGLFFFASETDKVQCCDINEFECIGSESNTDDHNIKQDISHRIANYLKSQKIEVGKNNKENLKIFCDYTGLNNELVDNQKKWIYFGCTNKKWKDWFRLSNDQNANIYEPQLKNIDELTGEWIENYALRKFNDHCVSDTFRLQYTGEINDEEYSEDLIKQIIKYWFNHQKISYEEIAKKVSVGSIVTVNENFVKLLIVGNAVATNNVTNTHLKRMEDYDYEYYDLDKCYAKYNSSLINAKMTKMHIYKHTLNVYTSVCKNDFIPINEIIYQKTNVIINDLMIGQWEIMNTRVNDSKILLEMYSVKNSSRIQETSVTDKSTDITVQTINNNNHLIQSIALLSSEDNEVVVNDPVIYTQAYKFKSHSEIQVSNNWNTKTIKIYLQRNMNDEIYGIKVIDVTMQNNENANHSDCWCNFKGVFVRKQVEEQEKSNTTVETKKKIVKTIKHRK